MQMPISPRKTPGEMPWHQQQRLMQWNGAPPQGMSMPLCMQMPIQRINRSSSFVPSAFRPLANGNPDPALLAFQRAHEQTRGHTGIGFNLSQASGHEFGLSNVNTRGHLPQQGHSMLEANMSAPDLMQCNIPTDPFLASRPGNRSHASGGSDELWPMNFAQTFSRIASDAAWFRFLSIFQVGYQIASICI